MSQNDLVRVELMQKVAKDGAARLNQKLPTLADRNNGIKTERYCCCCASLTLNKYFAGHFCLTKCSLF